MKRSLKPRATIEPRPLFVSQLTSLSMLGVQPRLFLERVIPLCGGSVVRLGKLRLVALDVVVDALQKLALSNDAVVPDDDVVDEDNDDEFASADAFLAKLGRRRTA
jgi:hypothetical protein